MRFFTVHIYGICGQIYRLIISSSSARTLKTDVKLNLCHKIMIVWLNKKEIIGFSYFLFMGYILCTNCPSLHLLCSFHSMLDFRPHSQSFCYSTLFSFFSVIRQVQTLSISFSMHITYRIENKLFKLEFHQELMPATF